MTSDSEVQFVDRQYGKHFVRLLHVRRDGALHHVRELSVNVRLTLDTDVDYTTGDNSRIIATDSQKNTVYILAKRYGVECIEKFAMLLTNHFLSKYPWVTDARVEIEQQPWKRIQVNGKDHVHAFISNSDGTRFCHVHQRQRGSPQVSAGISGLKVMKTTKSAFVNFVKDEYRSLPDMLDRVFCTIIYARWQYGSTNALCFDKAWDGVRKAILDTFAGPADTGVFSASVQKTLYDAQKLALATVPQMGEIEIILPNVHAYEYDFSKFPALGIGKNNEVFQPTDQPSGNIRATLKRRTVSKL